VKYYEIQLRNYATYLDSDEIVLYSMLRLLKNKIDNEVCTNVGKLNKLVLLQDGNDLVMRIYLS